MESDKFSDSNYSGCTLRKTMVEECTDVENIKWFKLIGTAVLIAIACIDPGNLQADIEVSQNMYYKCIWVVFFSHILLYFFQAIAIKLALYSGKDLGQLIRLNYPRWISLFLWICSELAIIAADIQEILGAAIAFQLLFGLELYLSTIIIVVIVFLILIVQEYGQKIFEGIFGIMVSTLAICFMINFCLMDHPVVEILKGFIPNLPDDLSFTGVVGSIIMPQNFFLQTSLILTRNIRTNIKKSFNIFKIEIAILLAISFLINFCLICIFANPYYADKEIDLSNAGEYLQVFLPKFSALLWGLGLLASGLSSTTTGALTGQYIMDGIFNTKISRIKRILVTRIITLFPCLLIILTLDIENILNILNIIQFIQCPFALIPLLIFATNDHIMEGKHLKGLHCYTLIFFSLLLQAINVYGIFDAASDIFLTAGWWILIVVVIIYLGFLVFLSTYRIKGVKYELHL
jgi:Mn2+/Fe2+ NRAMP family transporter